MSAALSFQYTADATSQIYTKKTNLVGAGLMLVILAVPTVIYNAGILQGGMVLPCHAWMVVMHITAHNNYDGSLQAQ